MMRLRFFNGCTVKAIVWFPLALIYWPLVSWNYYQRSIGALPDEWHWADRWLVEHGWCVSNVSSYIGWRWRLKKVKYVFIRWLL